jgi:contractile injection system spike tip protein
MGDVIIRSGDLLKVTIPPPVLVPMLAAPVPLLGSGTSVLAEGMPVCLLGDELPAELTGPLPYTAPPFTIPGTGTLTLTLLPPNLTAQTMLGKPLLIKGQAFDICLTVETPATQPSPDGPVPDPVGVKPGTAVFLTTNATVTAS